MSNYKDLEKRAATLKRYRENNLDKIRQRSRDFLKKYPEKRKEYRESLKGRYAASKGSAKYQGREWDLSIEEYESITSKSCDYCGHPVKHLAGGLDRLDNSKGYTKDNVVPCCRDCNRIRGEVLTPYETKILMGVLNNLRSKAS